MNEKSLVSSHPMVQSVTICILNDHKEKRFEKNYWPKLSALQTWDVKFYCSTNHLLNILCSWIVFDMWMQKCHKYPCANNLNGCRLPNLNSNKWDLMRMRTTVAKNKKTSFHFHELHLKFPVLHADGRYHTRKKGKGSICKMKDRKLID